MFKKIIGMKANDALNFSPFYPSFIAMFWHYAIAMGN